MYTQALFWELQELPKMINLLQDRKRTSDKDSAVYFVSLLLLFTVAQLFTLFGP
jgi:hypothetical protein